MPADIASLEAAFSEAIDVPRGPERDAILERACAGDDELRRQVESLLALNERAGHFLEAPATGPVSGTIEPLEGTIGPYKLLEEIGEGGMGVVYMAEQVQPVRRRVALKVIRPGMDSRQVIARFEAERQALALMDHPNIAKVHDAGATASGRPYFVMELVRGLPITEFCDREQVAVPQRLELFVLVCRAVQHAHQKGIIHRDLKPSNVLVTVIDGVPTPKVIDFGVAKATGGGLTDRTLFTGFHQMIGTPLYMSPEQADLSSADVDTRSDIYALGVLLYELLTGSTPFERERFAKAAFDEMRRIIREDEPPKPSTRLGTLGETLSTVSARRGSDPRRLNRVVRGELDWIAMKALEKDRRRRYETANDFATDVMRYLTNQPVEACPPTAGYRLRKLARRNRTALLTVGLVALTLVAGIAASLWQAIRATEAERRTASALASARSRQHLARLAVDEMYTKVARDWLAKQGGVTRLQHEFLEKALAFYEGFASEADANPEAKREAARALAYVGEIRSKLGQHKEAEAAIGRAVERFEGLAKEFPASPPYRGDLGWALKLLGGEQLKLGQRREAEESARKSIAVLEPLTDEVSGEAAYRRDLVTALILLGNLTGEAGRHEEAERFFRKGQEITRTHMAENPSDAMNRRLLAIIEMDMGIEFRETGRPTESEAAYRRAATLFEGLRATAPDEPDYRQGLADTWLNLGSVLASAGKRGEAEKSSYDALQLYEKLAGQFPDHPQYRDRLIAVLGNLDADIGRGRSKESEPLARRAMEVAETLVADFPDVPDYRHRLVESIGHYALHKGYARRFDEKERLERRSVEIAEKLVADLPGMPAYQRSLIESLTGLATTISDRPREAIVALEKALRLAESLRSSNPGSTEYRDMLANLYGSMAGNLAASPDPGCRNGIRAVELALKGLELRPNDNITLHSLAWARYRTWDWKGCREALSKNTSFAHDDFFGAMASWQDGDKDRAHAEFEKANKVWVDDYANRWWGNAYPDPWTIRSMRDEAAALIGVKPPGAVAAPK